MQLESAVVIFAGMKKVILGFSGGVDSTAAAILLREAGYEVRLLTLDTTGSAELLGQAHRTALRLDMPWESCDVRERFRREIVDYFTESYRRGETPAPCTLCNVHIKWRVLYERMRETGCQYIATGHYVRIVAENGRYFVHKGIDPLKDQSYYLWGLPQEYLRHALTPLGEHRKSDIKATYGHHVPRRESMGVCFLEGRCCADFLRERLSGISPGEIVDAGGQVVGTHQGYAFYTIGQKKGLNTQMPGAVVTAIDARANRLVAGRAEELLHRNLILRDYHLTDPEHLERSPKLSVKIRGVGHNPGGYARIVGRDLQNLHILLDEPAMAAAAGQPAVLYEGGRVLGGGFLSDYF